MLFSVKFEKVFHLLALEFLKLFALWKSDPDVRCCYSSDFALQRILFSFSTMAMLLGTSFFYMLPIKVLFNIFSLPVNCFEGCCSGLIGKKNIQELNVQLWLVSSE